MKNYKELTQEDFQNLEEGQSFKTFNALCNFLGISVPSGGNSRAAALKKIQQFISIPDTKPFVVDKIYENIKPKFSSKIASWEETIFNDKIVAINSINHYSYYGDRQLFPIITKFGIMNAIGMSYSDIQNIMKGKCEDEELVKNYFIINNNIKHILDYWVFKGFLADFSEVSLYDCGKVESDFVEERTEVYLNTGRYLATDEDLLAIEIFSQQVLFQWNFSALNEVVKHGKWRLFEHERAILSDYKYVRVRKGYLVKMDTKMED